MARMPDALSHWHALLEGFQTSPLEFYGAVEEALHRREIPNAATSRVDWKEGGILSARREYLRVARGQLVFDVCAAPFGTGFFFSWWLAERSSSLGLLLLFLIPILALVVLAVCLKVFGAFLGFIAGIVLFPAVLWFLGKLVRDGALGSDTEDLVVSIPLIGRFYEWVFAPNTWYKMDTALMFQEAVRKAVLEVIDGLTSTKGIRALSELERKPIMRELTR
jgi:hypothetical protein